MQPTLLVLAAGIGSRYGGLKQVAGIGPGGEAIMEYAVYDAVKAGFGKVVFVIRHAIEEEFKARFAGKFDNFIAVEYVFQEHDSPVNGIAHWPPREKPWGTGHAMLMARHAIQEPFAVVNADDYYGADALRSMGEFLRHSCSPAQLAMVGYLLENTLSEHGAVSRGVCEVDADSRLLSVTERHKIRRETEGIFYTDEQGVDHPLSGNTMVSMNLWGFPATIFDEVERQFVAFFQANAHLPRAEFYIPTVVNQLLREGKATVKVLPSHGQWYGVTYQEDKAITERAFAEMARQGQYPVPLWSKIPMMKA